MISQVIFQDKLEHPIYKKSSETLNDLESLIEALSTFRKEVNEQLKDMLKPGWSIEESQKQLKKAKSNQEEEQPEVNKVEEMVQVENKGTEEIIETGK